MLYRARRDDDPRGAEAVKHVAGIDRDEPAFVDPERAALQRAAAAAVLVDEHDVPLCARRGLAPRTPAADHEHVHAAVLGVVAPVRPVLADLAETSDVAQELLVERPEPARPDHRPVVEADRCERPADLVRDREQVAIERAEDVLRAYDRAVAHRLDADAHVGHAVDGHHAVRTVAGAAEKAARPVVLEAA